METTHHNYPSKVYTANSIQLLKCIAMASTENKTAHYKSNKETKKKTLYKIRTTHGRRQSTCKRPNISGEKKTYTQQKRFEQFQKLALQKLKSYKNEAPLTGHLQQTIQLVEFNVAL